MAHHTQRMMLTPLEQRLTRENESLRAENKAQQIEIKLLREKIDLLIRRIFGKSSEHLDDGQLMLLLQGGDDGEKKTRPPAQAQASWRLRSRCAARMRRGQPSRAKSDKHGCRSICPPWTK